MVVPSSLFPSSCIVDPTLNPSWIGQFWLILPKLLHPRSFSNLYQLTPKFHDKSLTVSFNIPSLPSSLKEPCLTCSFPAPSHLYPWCQIPYNLIPADIVYFYHKFFHPLSFLILMLRSTTSWISHISHICSGSHLISHKKRQTVGIQAFARASPLQNQTNNFVVLFCHLINKRTIV